VAEALMSVQQAKWVWRFAVPPGELWPLLADTARINEAAGLPKHRIEETPQPDGTVIYTGHAKFGPFEITWRDVPVEWVVNRRFRHARWFHNGPFKSLVATLELFPDAAGTRGEYTLEVEPANIVGRLLLAAGFFKNTERTMSRLGDEAAGFAAGERAEPFTMPALKLPADARARLAALSAELERQGVAAALVRRLAGFIVEGAEVDLLHIRPLRLARHWQAAERDVIELCLRAVRAGLLALRWELLCPNCRGPKLAVGSLDQLPRGAHCPTCNIDYDRDFARNVELTFRPVEAIRPVAEGEFCLFGPMSTPHVVIQQTLRPGEIREIAADLAFGDYRLRPLHPGGETTLTWSSGGFSEVIAGPEGVDAGLPSMPGTVRLANNSAHEVTLVVESRAWVRDALTAHRATSMQTFRDLFATEVLRPGDEAGIGLVTLMFTDLKGSTALYARIGDAAAYRLVRDHFAFLAATIRDHDGAIIKTIGDAVMAAFSDPAKAIDAALAIQRNVSAFNRDHAGGRQDIVIKLGLHAGACIAVNLNGRLDYFGSTVNLAARVQGQSQGGDIVLSAALAADPGVKSRLEGLNPLSESAQVKGFEAPVSFLRISPAALAEPDRQSAGAAQTTRR
jgi:class 3 adenylate cyclase